MTPAPKTADWLADVRLTPEEESEALRLTLEAKRHRIGLERNQTMEKIRQLDLSIRGPRTVEALRQEVVGRGHELAQKEGWEKPFCIPDFSYDIFIMLLFYFVGDEAGMNRYGVSPRKGLLLYGGYGVGKTVYMSLFARNVVQSYRMVRAAEMEYAYGEKDMATATLERYTHMFANPYLAQYYNQPELGLCIDEFGGEGVASNYGKRDILIDIFEGRYANNCRGPKTHATTNLSLPQMENRYGGRVMDRMRQQYNLIEFPADAVSLRQ